MWKVRGTEPDWGSEDSCSSFATPARDPATHYFGGEVSFVI